MKTPFDHLSGAKPEDFEAFHLVQYEQGLVGALLNHYKLRCRGELLSLQESMTGERHMTLHTWHAHFPTFPIYLMAKRFRKLPEKCKIASLFRNFYEHPFVKAYEDSYDAVPDTAKGMSVGLIFPWPHLDSRNAGGLVFHDKRIDIERPGFRMCWVAPNGKPFYIQHLQTLLADIDHPEAWTP